MRFAVNCNEYIVKYIGPMGHAMRAIVYAKSKGDAEIQAMINKPVRRIISVTEV